MSQYTEKSHSAVDRHVVLHVRALMVERNIRSVAALQRLLISAGVDISNQQLNRIVDNRATLLNLTVINGLLKVLQCSVPDLFGEIVVPRTAEKPSTSKARQPEKTKTPVAGKPARHPQTGKGYLK